jgi:hypothetical protein
MRAFKSLVFLGVSLFTLGTVGACGDDDPPPPPSEETGQSCRNASECFRQLDGQALQGGEAVCIDEVPGGYCTHVCVDDGDCCAIPGECRTNFPQVCSPFQSRPGKHCFLSCEPADIADAGIADENAFCQRFAHASFNCRSSGGGDLNRKVCVP